MRLCQYDLIILDWSLPDVSGIELLKQFRSQKNMTPVLMLTGKDTVADIEAGLNTGADDYLTKPFDMRELSARVNALVRRRAAIYDPVLRTRTLALDTRTKQVKKNGQEVKLQPQEVALLEFLLRNPNDVFSVDALFARVWPSDLDASPDTVRVCITRIRNKIDSEGQPSIIKTVHRVGYQIDLSQ
ncbi:MAG TPA: response regulator transcription factor, partial [Candidatus Obscuribacterales bacterium]